MTAGHQSIRICWNKDVSEKTRGYLLYRTDDAKKAKDYRRMTLLLAQDLEYSFMPFEGDQPCFTDTDVLPLTTYYYAVATIYQGIDGDIQSPLSSVKTMTAPDLSVPGPPSWQNTQWMLMTDDSLQAWPDGDGGTAPPIAGTPVVYLSWQGNGPLQQFFVQRKRIGDQAWQTIANSTEYTEHNDGSFSFVDTTVDVRHHQQYRIKTVSSAGITADTFLVISLHAPDRAHIQA
jgi:hypothetical protein